MTLQSDGAIDAAVSDRVRKLVADLKLADPMSQREEPSAGSLRRRRGFIVEDHNGLATLSLLSEEGVLRWVYQAPSRGPGQRRARRGLSRAIGAKVLHEFSFREVSRNNILRALEDLDEDLTPQQGLKQLQDGKFVPIQNATIKGKVLLLVHGTFSKSQMFVDELTATPSGREFLARAAANYKAVLAFDHPTLSVSPWINALDLENDLAQVTGPIDVICHSRGGLLIAWWLRNARRHVGNVVFVGTPLNGTSLASPTNLRSALQGLTNVFKGLEAASALASTVVPFMGVVAGLSKIFGGILQLGASTPLADAAIVIVPGLAAQSRVINNAELIRLNRAQWSSTPRVHAVISNFQPANNDAQWWQVWKLLRDPRDRLLSWSANAIFQDKNDLVVDTDSMTKHCGGMIKKAQICDFEDSATVHHCNYFRQDKTISYLRKALML